MKDKLSLFFSTLNVPMIAFLALSIRIVVMGTSWGDAIAMLALAGLYGYHKFLNKSDENWKRKIEKEVQEAKNAAESAKNRVNSRTLYDSKEENTKKRYF